MKRLALRSLGLAAVTAGALLAMGAPAQADWSGFNSGFVTGNQISNTVQIPVNVCGNAIAVLGFASANCTDGGAYAYNGGGYDDDGYRDNGYDDNYRPYARGAAAGSNHHRHHHRHHNR